MKKNNLVKCYVGGDILFQAIYQNFGDLSAQTLRTYVLLFQSMIKVKEGYDTFDRVNDDLKRKKFPFEYKKGISQLD